LPLSCSETRRHPKKSPPRPPQPPTSPRPLLLILERMPASEHFGPRRRGCKAGGRGDSHKNTALSTIPPLPASARPVFRMPCIVYISAPSATSGLGAPILRGSCGQSRASYTPPFATSVPTNCCLSAAGLLSPVLAKRPSPHRKYPAPTNSQIAAHEQRCYGPLQRGKGWEYAAPSRARAPGIPKIQPEGQKHDRLRFSHTRWLCTKT
jgi:hypothetical protein